AYYQQSGPVRVSRDGTYYFSTAGIYDLCLSVYSAPANVDPDKQWINRVGGGWDKSVELKAGQDYYILVQSYVDPGWWGPHSADVSGGYSFVMAPPAPFRLNHGLADSWYNPETPGQGFFLDVFEQLNRVFLGWFTFSIEQPVAGDAGHRWMTALGPYAGPSAELAIEWATGGDFDAAVPVPKQSDNGTIQLDFTDCSSGQITYAWGGDGTTLPTVSGVIPIQRNATDSIALCESLYAGPGMPGPL
ncbi:MAG TPA: hypothetical protein VKN35_01280, partial [Xanthomonadales bacterium]|nr:hypothetical protein [Xanthomonadales bacterium]